MYQCHELTYRSNISDKLYSFLTHRPEMKNEELNENKKTTTRTDHIMDTSLNTCTLYTTDTNTDAKT